MAKQNCWEFKKCGRQVGGEKAKELGVCPASNNADNNKVNNGTNSGRVCWAIAGTLCGGKVQGTFADKQLSCMSCEFLKKVKSEEGDDFELIPE
jgi:hypothetical protein